MSNQCKVISSLLLSGIFLFLVACKNKKNTINVDLTTGIDQDIVFINLGEGDRGQIGNLLITIDSCHPALIAVDAYFPKEKTNTQDSILERAFKNIKNDIIAYHFDSNNTIIRTIPRLRQHVNGEGYIDVETTLELTDHFIPTKKMNDTIYESFALKVVDIWNPRFKNNFEPNKSIPIKFTRTQAQYIQFDERDLGDSAVRSSIKGKIVLIGYLGPSDEDKHFTPLRFVNESNADKPDTYGVIIVANEISTILSYEKKD